MPAKQENALVSVIIPTYNSGRTLTECLESIKAQTHRNVEVIVVDSNSEDNTCRIAEEYGARLFQLDGVPNRKRNYGIMQAKGDYILHLDSDMLVTSGVIEECVSRCLSEGADALQIAEGSITLNFWAECIASHKVIFEESNILLARFFKKSVFEKIKFDEELFFGDDLILFLELKKMGCNISKTDAKIMHYEPTSLRGMIRSYYERFKSMPACVNKYGAGASLTVYVYGVKATARKWILSGRFLRDPAHFSGLLFIESMRYTAAAAGFLAGLMGKQFHSH